MVDWNWNSDFFLSNFQRSHPIVLPGYTKDINLRVMDETGKALENCSLKVYYIYDEFKNYYSFLSGQAYTCQINQEFKLGYTTYFNYSSAMEDSTGGKNMYYYVFFRMYIIKFNQKIQEQDDNCIKKSWNEAYGMCKSVGGHLPIIRNKEELDEIIDDDDVGSSPSNVVGRRHCFYK